MDEQTLKNGALIDERTDEAKAKDYTFDEVVASAAPVEWKEKSPDEWRSFPIFDQDSSGSCVAQTLKKMLGIYVWLNTNIFVHLSASHIYQRRQNRPSGGMGGVDAFEIARQGTTLEDFVPSEDMNDGQMDNVDVKPFMSKIGEIFRIGNYITVTSPTIDDIASIIQQTGKGVMVWFYFSNGLSPREWTDVPEVQHDITLTGSNTSRHSVTAVDFTLHEGKKALIIEDSWGEETAIDGRRIITEDFFNARNWFAAYFMNFRFEDQTQPDPSPSPKPSYDGATIISVQKCLRYEGLFPTNIDFIENFGPITQRGVMDFQVRYGLHPTGVPNIGPLTRQKLHELYP